MSCIVLTQNIRMCCLLQVGFGDISASNGQERLFCVIVMFLGSVIFGTLLAEIQEAVNQVCA